MADAVAVADAEERGADDDAAVLGGSVAGVLEANGAIWVEEDGFVVADVDDVGGSVGCCVCERVWVHIGDDTARPVHDETFRVAFPTQHVYTVDMETLAATRHLLRIAGVTFLLGAIGAFPIVTFFTLGAS